jgi:hypothetical protein
VRHSSFLAYSDRVYRLLLRGYPAKFREHFADEMAQVFRSLCSEAYQDSGSGGVARLWISVLWDWAWAAISQWRAHLLKGRVELVNANSNKRHDGARPLSVVQAGIAAFPFLLFGISVLALRMPYFQTAPANLPLWQVLFIHPYLVFNWLILIGLAAGILMASPRWTYSYLGWAILFALWWSNMGFYGYSIGWKIWLPLLGVFLVAISIRRSWQPLRACLAGIMDDWMLPSLAIYILYGGMYMLYDSNHHPYVLVFIAATALAISLGAWGYFTAVLPLTRVLALMAGLFAATVLSAINEATWDFGAYYGLPESTQNVNLVGFIFLIVLALLMLVNAWLARRHLSRLSH